MNQEIKICQNCKQNFTIETEDFVFYDKIKVPSPTWCPECRMVRRFIWRNERSLYKRQCGLCNKNILSIYSSDKPFSIFCPDCWWSDKWNSIDYRKDYDFSKPFFMQFYELIKIVPNLSLWGFNNVNSEYGNYIAYCKDIYLSQSAIKSENIYYSYLIDKSKDCFDCYRANESEICYENINGAKNYNSIFIINSRQCMNSEFLFDCNNCQECFMSSNLRNKRFYIRNKAYSKEEYFEELKK